MSNKPKVGGSIWKAAVNGADREIQTLARLVEELSKPGIDNGNRHRLKAEIMAALLRQKEHLAILKEIGQEARQERREE